MRRKVAQDYQDGIFAGGIIRSVAPFERWRAPELTATLTEDGSTAPKAYSGALSMKHVGICTQDGPEEKNGKIRVQMTPSESRIKATLWVDGVERGYQGVLSDFYTGIMDCSGRGGVPLKLWIKETKQAQKSAGYIQPNLIIRPMAQSCGRDGNRSIG